MIQPLGIGFPYYAALPADLYRPDLVAFVEVTPETICRQRGTGKTTEIKIRPGLLEARNYLSRAFLNMPMADKSPP